MTRLILVSSLVSVMFLGALTAQADKDRSGRRFWGLWEAVDSLDGSTEQVSISGRPDGSFNLLWRESYWTICGGRRGILIGSGDVDPDDRNTLVFQMTITCFDPEEVVLEDSVSFTLVGRNLLLATDPGAFTDLPFFRVSGRVRGDRDHDD
ncbi:MAG: hypothetical protein AAEJ52_09590 [Myxococcota bacterium]